MPPLNRVLEVEVAKLIQKVKGAFIQNYSENVLRLNRIKKYQPCKRMTDTF